MLQDPNRRHLLQPAEGRVFESLFWQTLRDQRYVIIPQWLSDAQTDALQADAMAVHAFGSSFDCCVGADGHGYTQLDQSVRKSSMCTFYPPPSNSAGSVAARADFVDCVQNLRCQLQASAAMSLPYLEPFQTEMSYLLYPVGGHYKRHLDVPGTTADGKVQSGWKLHGRPSSEGGSFCGGRTRRVVSFILYLNRKWDDANGGKLRVYNAAGSEHADGGEASAAASAEASPEASTDAAAIAEDITPEGGSLVLMMAADVEHMVRETHAERQCIVGWFCEYREERVQNMDTFGTAHGS